MNGIPYLYLTDIFTRTGADDFALVTDGKTTRTWGEFTRAAHGWELAFRSSGARRAAIYFTDIFDSGAALFGAWAAHIVAVLPADTADTTCTRLSSGVADVCAGDFPSAMTLPRVTPITTDEPCQAIFNEQDELLELFTSGSTGTPTLVKKRLQQMFEEVDNIRLRSGNRATPETLVISTVSQQHIYGLLYFLLWPVAVGLSIWSRRIVQPQELFEAALLRPSCAWVASPALLKRLPESPDWARVRDRWLMIFSSGGPLADEGLRRVLELTGVSPTELLGSSEAGGIAVRNRTTDATGNIINTEWHPLSSVEWKCVDGLLAIRGHQLYSSDWEVTTDRIRPNPDGQTFVHLGRVDRIVKINEKRVSLTAVESAVSDTSYCDTAKALQLEDERQSLAVVATLKPDGFALLQSQGKFALVQRLREELAKSFERVCLPRRWRFVTVMPENSMGKVTSTALRELFDAKTLQAVCVERTETTATYLVIVPADSPFFEGHFPGFAILPGLTQIQWAVELARTAFAVPPCFAGLSNLKFMKPISPASSVQATFTLAEDDTSVNFAFKTQDVTCAKGKILFSKEVPS